MWKQHLVCCLPSATISDEHLLCNGLIVLILQCGHTENTCGHTKAPKTWRSVAFCGESLADLKARGLRLLPLPKVLLCLNNSHLSRSILSPQSMHSSKRIICRYFLSVTKSWWAGHLLNGLASNDQSRSNGQHHKTSAALQNTPQTCWISLLFRLGSPKTLLSLKPGNTVMLKTMCPLSFNVQALDHVVLLSG